MKIVEEYHALENQCGEQKGTAKAVPSQGLPFQQALQLAQHPVLKLVQRHAQPQEELAKRGIHR